MSGWLDLAAGPLLVLLSAFAAVSLGAARAPGIEGRLWLVVGLGLLAARAAYVWRFHAAYLTRPWSILDVRDGGWSPEAGFATSWLLALREAVRRPTMRRSIAWAAVSGTTLWVAGAIGLYMASPDRGGVSMPPLRLVSTTGEAVDLQALRGRPVILNLWATWCPPCNREMPLLARAQAEHPEIQFVFADEGEPPERVVRWIAERGLVLRNVAVDVRQEAGASLGQQAFPTTYFFDGRGTLVGHRVGELSAATLADHIRATLTDHP